MRLLATITITIATFLFFSIDDTFETIKNRSANIDQTVSSIVDGVANNG